MAFAADIIRRNRQFILLLCLVSFPRSGTRRDALVRFNVVLLPLDGPHAVIRVDLAPGFVSLKKTNALQHLGVEFPSATSKTSTKILLP